MERHPVECGVRIENMGGAPHLGDHVCTHPAPINGEHDKPGYLAHACGMGGGCKVTWTRPTLALARMGREEALALGFIVQPEAFGVPSMAEAELMKRYADAKVRENASRCTVAKDGQQCVKVMGHEDLHQRADGTVMVWSKDGADRIGGGVQLCGEAWPGGGRIEGTWPVCVGVAGHEGPHAAPYLGTDPLGTEYAWTDTEVVSGPRGQVIPAALDTPCATKGCVHEAGHRGDHETPRKAAEQAKNGAPGAAMPSPESTITYCGPSGHEFGPLAAKNGADTPTHPTTPRA